jgi:uracil-DNA glycosylase
MDDVLISPRIDQSWQHALSDAFKQPSFAALKRFLLDERSIGNVYPKGSDIFRAFNLTPLSSVKVVILGQDPYHGEGQAHGLSFSVPKGKSFPPSLRNIFKELSGDLGISAPRHGDLTHWAEQGVLLLNATLTVRQNQAGSHQKKGWEPFTDAAIRAVSDSSEHSVFILWGGFAKAKRPLIDGRKHLILESVHPSPLSAYNGFFGCKHFSKTNAYLVEHHRGAIDWSLPD